MLSTLRWAGTAANANSLTDPNSTFDPTLPCASGEDASRDALVKADAPKRLVERLAEKPQTIGPDCLFENAETILRFFEEDIVLHVWQMNCSQENMVSCCSEYCFVRVTRHHLLWHITVSYVLVNK